MLRTPFLMLTFKNNKYYFIKISDVLKKMKILNG